MSRLSNYCKAYPVNELRAFAGWSEPEDRSFGGEEILFLHEDFTVTDSIYPDEGVVFSESTPAWRTFCAETLDFQIPPPDEP